MPPPVPEPAVLLSIVLSVIVFSSETKDAIPPPLATDELPLTELLSKINREPELIKIPPPMPLMATLLSMVLLRMVSLLVPSILIPPPLSAARLP